MDEITKRIGISKPGVSMHLEKLRIADIIRLEKRWPKTYYWIKHPKEVTRALRAIDVLITRTTKRIAQDY